MKCEQDIWFDVVHIEAVMGYFKEMASVFCGVTKRIRLHYVSHKLHQAFEDGPDRGFRNVGKT
jgi:hypothetical protein